MSRLLRLLAESEDTTPEVARAAHLGRRESRREVAEAVARRTRELLSSRGWCRWQCEELEGEVIIVARDYDVPGLPRGIPVYLVAELGELLGQRPVRRSTLRLVHEAKRLAGARVIGSSDEGHGS